MQTVKSSYNLRSRRSSRVDDRDRQTNDDVKHDTVAFPQPSSLPVVPINGQISRVLQESVYFSAVYIRNLMSGLGSVKIRIKRQSRNQANIVPPDVLVDMGSRGFRECGWQQPGVYELYPLLAGQRAEDILPMSTLEHYHSRFLECAKQTALETAEKLRRNSLREEEDAISQAKKDRENGRLTCYLALLLFASLVIACVKICLDGDCSLPHF